ncbi:hypothetical protein [Streptomyces sp. NBC_00306]|uniref:hypothetical protein n=1 Tax=Streptomyces sp. NBC_00306 TaxID=2975708 RepID=UPI002E287AA4|nr:hypothetical protein [Streptomyces sp. NBC_00306]
MNSEAAQAEAEEVAQATTGPDAGTHPEARPETGPETGAEAEAGTRSAAAPKRPPGLRRRTLAAVALLLALVLGGAAFLFATARLNDTPAARNRALTDTAATTEVIEDVSGALTQVFSYTPAGTESTRQAARSLLAGKAARQYGELFGQVEKRAAEQKLTLTTHVVRAGVTRLTGHSAHLLVFLDQVAERRGKPPATAAAQLSVTAELRGGRWQIVDIASR